MQQVIYRLETEIDFQRVTVSLTESGIPFTYILHSNSSFPSLNLPQAFGDIAVPLEHELALCTMIQELTGRQPLRVGESTRRKSGKKIRIWQVLLISYAVLISLICLRYWYLNQRTQGEKFYTPEWSFDARELILRSKETGLISDFYQDANYDHNFELSIVHSKAGIPMYVWKDLNEDGYFEESISYNVNGEKTGFRFDRDNNGIDEEVLIILENGDTLKLYDSNQDGTFEIKNDTSQTSTSNK
ncbi:MAG: hypothetical protein ACK5W1_09240 [Flavobacteriales bacterium]|jgi:hypothetical protein